MLTTLNNFLNDYFFVQNLLYIKGFSNEIIFKFLKNLKLKIINEPKIGQLVELKIEYSCHEVENEYKFQN